MRVKNTFFVFAVFCVAAIFSAAPVFSQTDSEDWFYGKPIKNIVFDNLKNVKQNDLDGVTSSFISKPFSDDLISELYDRVFSLEYFDDVEIKAAKNADNGKTVNLILSVVERPVVMKLNFDGNRYIHDADLKSKISLKAKDIFVESKVLEDERAIRNYYIEKGYTKISVESSFEMRDDGAYVTFKIREGRQTVVKSIGFAGNQVVSSKTLKGKISLKEAGLFKKGSFQESSLSADSRAIVAYYQNRGYADAKVVNIDQKTSYNEQKNREEIEITFEIQEGIQYNFGGITFDGNHVFTTEELENLVTLKTGAVYNETKFQETRMNIQNLYYENGYTSNRFATDINKDAESKVISYTIRIQENSRSHIENIIIKGNEKTKDFVIRREIPIEEGDIFSNAKISNGMRNLYNLQYFSAVSPEVLQGSEENLVDIVFTVEEQSTTSLDFGFTFSGVSDPGEIPIALTARIQDSNIFGEGKLASVGTTLSTNEQSVSLSYGQSWLFNKPISTNVSLSYSHSNNYALRDKILPSGDIDNDYYYMQYEQNQFSLGLSLGHRWTPNFAILTLSGGVTSSLINNLYDDSLWIPYDTSISQYSDNWEPRNSIWTSFSMDGRNISWDPSSGWFASQRLSWYGLMHEGFLPFAPDWGETEFYLRTDTKAEKYFTLVNKPITDSWALKLVLMGYSGLSFQFSALDSTIKKNNQLYIDGMFNGRGWTIYNSDKGRGKALWCNSLELRMPVIPGIFSLDLWGDAVAITDEPYQFFNLKEEDWYFSFGPSFRFSIQQFPLRLLFANTFKIKDGSPVFTDQDGDGDYNWTKNWNFVLSFSMTNR